MKKIIIILVVLFASLSLASCGTESSSSTEVLTTSDSQSSIETSDPVSQESSESNVGSEGSSESGDITGESTTVTFPAV